MYGGLVFGFFLMLSAIIAFFGITLGGPKTKYNMHWAPRYACRSILFFSGLRYKLFNYNRIDESAQYIFIANHVNSVDIVFVRSVINNYLKILGKAELLKMPFMSIFAKHLAVTVDRKDKTSRKESFGKMNQQLQETGASLLIYPEGTRNKTEDILQPFKKGAFNVAIENGLPIACLTLVGLEEVMPKGKNLLYPGLVNCYVDVFDTAGLDSEDAEELMHTVRTKMLSYLEAGQS